MNFLVAAQIEQRIILKSRGSFMQASLTLINIFILNTYDCIEIF
jgi:hypothetical protein